jgi:hypothetical protein
MDVVQLEIKETWQIKMETYVTDGVMQQFLAFILANFQTSLLFLFQVGGDMLGACI